MKVFVSALLVGIGFMAVSFFWPQSIDLPKMGSVKEWRLADTSGEVIDNLEKPKLVTFFYTNCPDICPTTTLDLKDLQQLMKEKGVSQDQYLIISITLDPTFDTNDKIQQYKNAFDISDTNWLFLRGSEEVTKEFTHYFNFAYDMNQDGFITHSTSMYVVDQNDQIRAHHTMAIGENRVDIEEIAGHLLQLIEHVAE
ncbi:SCO family protein [Paenisporosarcina sp. TG-14]|uniref:SCO family protein n=1 Tax=Paenisporosarcina sp. TG-14 TaxID=1231057 RepID=UPI0002ED1B64|nr:SCO family protein [Paenisporosarcina sp. TG-14]